MEIMVRDATPADIHAIAAIYGASVLNETSSFELEPPTEAEMLRRFEVVKGGGNPYLVAEGDGRILGYGYAGAYHARPAYRFTVENSVYVAADAKRLGIGKHLVEALIDQCEKRGKRQMIAVIGGGENSSASIALHQSLGFVKVGEFANLGWKHGKWLSVVYMQRSLGEGAGSEPVDL